MKRTLKITIVITLLFTLICPNFAVIAADLTNNEANTATVEEQNNEQVNNSSGVTEKTPEENNENANTTVKVDNDDAEKKGDDENGELAKQNEYEKPNDENKQADEVEQSNEAKEQQEVSTYNKEKEASEQEISTISNSEESGKENNEEEAEDKEDKSGKLFINIDLRLPQASPKFDVTLKKGDKAVSDKPTINKNDDGTMVYYTFDGLEPGDDYKLTISGKGYIPFSQTLEIKSKTTSEISFTNGYDSSELHDDENHNIIGKKGYGVVPIGDFNSDKQIDEKDTNAIVNRIEENSKKSSKNQNVSGDLNGDNQIDIVDLSYAFINRKEKNQIITGLVSFISQVPEDAKITTDKTEIANGVKIEEIFKNDGDYVSLKPANGEEIDKAHPVSIELELKKEKSEIPAQEITIAPSPNPENNIEAGSVSVVGIDENGKEVTIECDFDKDTEGQPVTHGLNEIKPIATLASTNPVKIAVNDTQVKNSAVSFNDDGTIVVDLGGKIAVKKITITVTKTKSNKLADISKVEFLNGMSDKIPEPVLSIPENVSAKATEYDITVSWDYVPNVTGYEVFVTNTKTNKSETFHVDGHVLKIERFDNDFIKNMLKQKFAIQVRSVNGEWVSGYSTPIVYATPTSDGIPNPPTGVNLTGAYKEIQVTWDADSKADSYEVWYRPYESGDFIQLEPEKTITDSKYTIKNLIEKTKYQVYVVSVNKHGKSAPSVINTAETTTTQPVKMPKRNLINTANKAGTLTNHIKDVKLNNGYMVGSSLDETAKTAKGVVDNSYESYFQVDDWDVGGWYAGEKTPTITFDKKYKMNYFTIAQAEWLGTIGYAKVTYYEGTKATTVPASQVYTAQDEDGNNYTVVKLPKPITTDKISIGIGRTNQSLRKITIAEMCFYKYDDLEERINDLYSDQMHIQLKDSVTKATIEKLEKELNTKDKTTGEYHPEREKLQDEIDAAKEILAKGAKLTKTTKIDTNVTKFYDGHIEFTSGLNAWQPLGAVAYSGDEITVYVGNEYKTIGESTNLELIITQYHAQAGNGWKQTYKLSVGKNVITVPQFTTYDVEKGGSLYINYTGLKDDHPFKSFENSYGVRVEGAYEIPVLDLTKASSENDRKEAVKKYVKELEDVVKNIESKHNSECVSKDRINKDYNDDNGINSTKRNCLIGATEIVLDQIMLSASSEQILAGLGEGSTDTRADKLYSSMCAMEDMVDLFYSYKGLSKDSVAGAKNQYPKSRLNIRYMRMSGRAFMYAGGEHIGIEWPELQILAQGQKITTTTKTASDGSKIKGAYKSGKYFGWGIAHEIGHVINQQAYVHGEVTNNYFALLAQAEDTNESIRFNYPDVYEKVTSGKIGKCQDVFTQLGLYWQLHLAYDKGGYNFVTYDNYQDWFDNSIFGRMDTYARDTSKAPKAKENGVDLKLEKSDTDNNLMRLACAATEKNLLEFFEKWGLVPNADTKAYAKQWQKETRAIYYINDDARTYQLEKKSKMKDNTKVVASAKLGNQENQVNITVNNNNSEENKNAMLGYEIIRTYMQNDVEKSDIVAFVTADGTTKDIVYTDTIELLNNRVFTYKVVAYDKYLEKTEVCELKPIKVSHEGIISGNKNWTIETNLKSEGDVVKTPDSDSPDAEGIDKKIVDIIDNNHDNEYIAKETYDGKPATFTISLDTVKRIVGFKYTAKNDLKLENYTVEISMDGEKWETVKTVEKAEKSNKVYFNKENDDKLYMYDTSFIRFTFKDTKLTLSEIEFIGQTGDNVDLVLNGIGKLEKEVTLGTSDATGAKVVIPKDAIVFTGQYKGNPAYNVVKLWNQDNELISGSQTFFADPVKEGGELGEVSEGLWFYWVEPTMEDEDGKKVENPAYEEILSETGKYSVRAELYRVDDAMTLEGERLTSDSYRVEVPKEMPKIQLNTDGKIQEK